MKKFISISWISLFLILSSCVDENQKGNSNPASKTIAKPRAFKVELETAKKLVVNQEFSFRVEPNQEGQLWDSVQLSREETDAMVTFTSQAGPYSLNSGPKTGIFELTFNVFYPSGKEEIKKSIEVFSNQEVKEYSFQVVNTLPHDPSAFTQGLVISEGVFYEGTGMKGASELRKVELKSGKVLARKELSSSLFGEGITLYNENIYQLTWKAGIAMVYDKNSFKEISKLSYRGDGWGITNDSLNLIMSNGSNLLKYVNPQDFSIIRTLQVYDENGAVGYLNELEWVKGRIYANVWQKEYILIIHPQTGMVEGRINLHRLLPSTDGRADVLNGIAYDPESNKLYVTGKYWPYIYEIKLMEKGSTSS